MKLMIRARQMKSALKLLLVSLALLAGSCRDPMEHAHCDDKELKRVPSPDGKLVIVIYDRSCSGGSGLYTYAEVQDSARWDIWPQFRHSEVCFLVTLAGGYHQLDARWLDSKHIEVSSTDWLERDYSISSQHDTCNEMAVTYNFRFKLPPIQEAPDKQTVEAISEAINQTEACINNKFAPAHADYLRSLVNDKQHREALELLCTNLDVGECPISKETYVLLEQAATKMDIPNTYLENLKPLVR